MAHWISIALVALALCVACAAVAETPHAGHMALTQFTGGKWRFEGPLGARVDANIHRWLLRAPAANPGIIEMFHRRDRRLPYPELVPWAGEFAGKYLISAVQACRMTGDIGLRDYTREFVRDLLACQDKDGYLGPFSHDQRLMGQWDLWGHYHCMLGLLMWSDMTGDKAAREAIDRAAECICKLYIDKGRSPIESGTAASNLSVMHIMAELYRRTGNPRWLKMVKRIEADLPKAGDWLVKGADGVPYYKLPADGPRWESLHIVQAFVTMYEATGEVRYRKAAVALWDSIRKYDRHPSGAFSSNEGASGTIFAAGSIETCCSVAWMALSVDVLRMTGDPAVADELELTLWNQALGAQHPAGDWCTYDTPLNGVRIPSYHHINFQYRPGAPELNCCSVNSPRTLGMIPEWALLRCTGGVAVNFYGPCTLEVKADDKLVVQIHQETAYPVDGKVALHIAPSKTATFSLALRIPAWSAKTSVAVNGVAHDGEAVSGKYLVINRKWKRGDVVDLGFDMAPRLMQGGAPDRGGRVAISAGPLLLAYDAQYNTVEVPNAPSVNAAGLKLARMPVPAAKGPVHFAPMGLWKVNTDGHASVLCDFASAGMYGTEYASWLKASHVKPAPVKLGLPAAGAVGRPGPVLFRWSASGSPGDRYQLTVWRTADPGKPVIAREGLEATYLEVTEGLGSEGEYAWKVVTRNEWSSVDSVEAGRTFRVDASAPAPFLTVGPGGLLAASGLDGSGAPSFGACTLQSGLAATQDRNGRAGGALLFNEGSRLRYSLPFFPETDYTFMAWICPAALPVPNIQQVFSAWCRGMDDPLRVTVDGDEVSARMESGGGWRTPGVRLEAGRWVHVAAVKQGGALTLYVGGVARGSVPVPARISTLCTEIGIGFNPLYTGGEHFTGAIDDFSFVARALGADEVRQAAR